MAVKGSGDYTYEVAEDWLKLPPEMELGKVYALAPDSQDNLFAFIRTSGGPSILIFDREGNFLSSWGEGIITDAHGIYISPQDEVFLTDGHHHQVMKFTLDGNHLLTLGNLDVPGDQVPFNVPTDAMPGPSGNFYVSDGVINSRVHKFSPDGTHLTSWGTPGDAPGQFNKPHAIWVDRDERVYVCDQNNSRIQVFDSEGNFITHWTDFQRPTDIFMDAEGTFYVSGIGMRVSILRHDGTLLTRWGEDEPLGHPGREGIHGLCVDSRGNIYAGRSWARKIEKYVRR